MKNKIVKDLKEYIRLNLEERIYQIMNNTDKVRMLSKRDLISIVNFMKKNNIYSRSILEYIYVKSTYRYCSEPFLPDLDNDVLIDAVEKGNLDVIKLLLSQKIRKLFPKIDPSTDDNYVIGLASRYGHLDIVKYLLSQRIRTLYPSIDPSANDNYAIKYASQYGKIDVVKYLLSPEVTKLYPNIDPSVHNNYAIRSAIQRGHLEVVKFLLSDEIIKLYPTVDPGAYYDDAIRLAHQFGHTELVEFLRIHVYNSVPLSDILQNKI